MARRSPSDRRRSALAIDGRAARRYRLTCDCNRGSGHSRYRSSRGCAAYLHFSRQCGRRAAALRRASASYLLCRLRPEGPHRFRSSAPRRTRRHQLEILAAFFDMTSSRIMRVRRHPTASRPEHAPIRSRAGELASKCSHRDAPARARSRRGAGKISSIRRHAFSINDSRRSRPRRRFRLRSEKRAAKVR